MGEIMAIASGTWKNILRMKVVYFLIVCVWVLIGVTVLYDVLSLGQHKDLMIDASLFFSALAVGLVLISITFEIPRELKQGVAATLLTKSLGRTQYLFGKFIGIAVAAAAVCALIVVGSFIIFSLSFTEPIAVQMFQAQLLQGLAIIPMAGMAVFFGTLFPEVVAPVVTILAFWFSYSTAALSNIPVIYGGLLPNLNFFNLRELAVYHVEIPWSYIGLATVWGLAFALFALMLTSLFFKAKDIK